MVESKLVSSLRFNQKGQGTIEYVLLLIITISMIMLAMANVFRPMQKFMQNFMGTYVACLLSSGELPAIRTENKLKDEDAQCNFSFPQGSGTVGTGGTPGTGGTGTNNNGSDPNGNGSNGANGSGKDGNGNKLGSNENGSSSGGGSGGNSYAGSRSRRSAFGSGSGLRRSSDSGGSLSDDAGADGGKRYVNNLDKNGSDRFYKTQRRAISVPTGNGRGIAMGGMTEEEQKKQERKIQVAPRAVPKNNEEFSVPGKKNVLKPPPVKEKNTIQEKDEGFTFAGLLKYLFIAVILLLILILGGGQAFEMSKSMD